jgi:solute carrier family 35 protein E1
MARASTEGERARTLLPYWGLRALHTVTRVHVLAPQPNALLGARSNVARISQRGPHMLLAGEGLRSARAMPLLPQATESKPTHTVTKMASTAGEKKFNIDIQLILYFALWYLGNYYYNISNKMALKAAGGAAGFPLTIATLQLGVGMIYALFLWAAPDAREVPKTTKDDILACIPVAFCSAAAHSFSVFALSAGAVSFGQIVKAAEPAFAALLGVSLSH